MTTIRNTIFMIPFLTSCGGQLYSVSDTKGGIPFHEVEFYEVTSKVYQQSYFALRLSLDKVKADGTVVSKGTALTVYTQEGSCLAAAIRSVRDAPSATAALASFDALGTAAPCQTKLTVEPPSWKQKSDFATGTPPADVRLVAEKRERRQRLKDEVSYINVHKAAIGTTSGTITLNDKGQLVSAQASSEDRTAEVIADTALDVAKTALGVFPITKGLESAWGLSDDTKDDDKNKSLKAHVGGLPAGEMPRVSLEISELVRLYALDTYDGNTDFSATTPAVSSAPPKADEKNAVSFSGSIRLPESK